MSDTRTYILRPDHVRTIIQCIGERALELERAGRDDEASVHYIILARVVDVYLADDTRSTVRLQVDARTALLIGATLVTLAKRRATPTREAQDALAAWVDAEDMALARA